ncbi:RimK family alpha-L-glutamate ligase [Streptomyces sp. NPDC050400]|uniref:RimK family alpha-L-glutamate ligase n=1 Tax=Streptomyces sp. NPDC050400 TaxID=3365610 RepID=UPI0037A2D3F1
MPRIALVTYRPGPDMPVDRDLPLLAEELRRTGADADVLAWDDPAVDWAAFDLVVVRSTWDYSWRRDEFLEWAARCADVTRLANPVDVLRWSTDKRYLGELARHGVPTVPTSYVALGDVPELPADGPYVIKPTSGAGARYAARYTQDERDAALRQVARMHAEGLTAMVQPYVEGIDESGERAVLFYGGRFLHAIRKGAVLTAGVAYDERKVAHPSLEPWQPTAAELAVAEQALAAVPGGPDRLLYARVDLVDGADGRPCVMELELVEPNLFLSAAHPASAPVVAEAIAKAAGT